MPTPTPPATLANWQDPPHNRWGFQHVRELIPTARIERSATPRPLPEGDHVDLGSLRLAGEGPATAEEALGAFAPSGFMVLHRGRVVAERYFQGLTPSRPHLLMSVSKSITATVAGILAGRGELDPQGLVTDAIPRLRGTAWDGATVQHLLDMRAGTSFDEDYSNLDADVRVYEQVYQWRPRTTPDLPADGHTYIAGLRNKGPHGGPFDYRSILTDVLGWVLEEVAGATFAELVERELWQPMGAEFDADVTVDGHGHALADGGICCTLRDLARFGQLWADGGVVDGRQVLPIEWIRDTLAGGPDSREAFIAGGRDERFANGHYRNQVWVVEPDVPIAAGLGINGQAVAVHGHAEIVLAQFSTLPTPLNEDFVATVFRTVDALAEALG
jgi:CubicO group peptidase (beta-lactamase class C family)